MGIVAWKLGSREGVEGDREPLAGPRDLRPYRLGAVVVPDGLPAVEEVHLHRPAVVDGNGDLQTGLVIGRELAHPPARVVPVVLGEEALVTDVRGIDACLEEDPAADGCRVADACLVDRSPDLGARGGQGGLGGVDHVQPAAEGQREMEADGLRIERDVDRRGIDVEFVCAPRGRPGPRQEARAVGRPVRIERVEDVGPAVERDARGA